MFLNQHNHLMMMTQNSRASANGTNTQRAQNSGMSSQQTNEQAKFKAIAQSVNYKDPESQRNNSNFFESNQQRRKS